MRGASPHVGQVRRPGRREPWRGGVASGWVRGAGGRADVNFIIAQTVADVTSRTREDGGNPGFLHGDPETRARWGSRSF